MSPPAFERFIGGTGPCVAFLLRLPPAYVKITAMLPYHELKVRPHLRQCYLNLT